MTNSLAHHGHEIATTLERVHRRRMTTGFGGSISVRDSAGGTWITPARLDKRNLRAIDIVHLAADGSHFAHQVPSPDHPFHLGIFNARPDLRAIIHADPESLVSFSICGQVPATRVLPETWQVCGPAGFARYALPGSELLGRHIAEVFESNPDCFCVLLENHGVVVVGKDLASAFRRFEMLDFAAETILHARLLGEVHCLADAQLELARTPRAILPEQILPASPGEAELRTQLCDSIQAAAGSRLINGSEGSFSVRTGADEFLVTPAGANPSTLAPGDLLLIREGVRCMNRRPASAVRVHRAIYREHPEICAILHTLPIHATAFSVSDFHLDTRTIPESYLFLKEIGKIPFRHFHGSGWEVAIALSPAQSVALVENNGALVAGRSIPDAFERLEVLDSTASAILRSHPLGPLAPMPREVIDELVAAFPSA
jgi:L-fuculose-phosphate aldolase